MKYSQYIYVVLLLLIMSSCKNSNTAYTKLTKNPTPLHTSINSLTDVIVHDIFSPPVASRNYAYPCIAAYEVSRHLDSSYLSLANQLNDFDTPPLPDKNKEYAFELAATHAFFTTAKAFIFNEEMLENKKATVMAEYEAMQIPYHIYKNSIEYGVQVSAHILAYADKDNYKQSRSFPKYTVSDKEFEWKPTPPAYMDGIEPHWREIRPFVIKSADQFTPPLPTKVDMTKGSPFYKEVIEVFETVNNASKEEKEIASFWDCNPFVMNVTGHVMHATKKITPGGHWMGIAKIACEKDSASFVKAAATYAQVSIALMDGFISCWDEKYRSVLIRPETLINEHLDDSWIPLLQTPPFPEYTSGHSVISAASAEVLTSIYGDDFQFTDDTELEYGLPIRKFDSFYDAAAEAAISRLYGGIHYRPAIDNGVKQGSELGKYVVSNLKLR